MLRKRSRALLRVGSIAAVLACGLLIVSRTHPALKSPAKSSADSASSRMLSQFGRLPLYFIENQGQVDGQVAYYLQGKDNRVYFTSEGVVFALTEESKREPRSPFQPASYRQPEPRDGWAVKLEFIGGDPGVKPVGLEQTEATVSYFKGRHENWTTGLATYSSVAYKNLWPGIDLVYAGTNGRLKYTFTVAPGADPAQVRLTYRGASAVKLDEQGRLQIDTPVDGFSEDKPYVYQEIDGQRVEVESAYELAGEEYGFRLGDYDHTRPLVLDPVVLVYAGFIGGIGSDAGEDIAVDRAGNAYITGTTDSTEASFPVKVGPDSTYAGQSDAFVVKVNAAGTGLVYGGYIGGSGIDRGSGIAVDSAGNAYVTGWTGSSESTFPVKFGPDVKYHAGTADAFVAKLNAAGTGLVYAGYIGGSNLDTGTAIAVDKAGNAYVTGYTASTETTFPVKVGPDVRFNGGIDAFVAKVNASGSALDYAGYIGGRPDESASGIAVDGAGNAYVAGTTYSREDTFPALVGPDTTYNGAGDAFVAKVNASGTALAYAGYIGGSLDDSGSGIAVDSYGNAYVVGITNSNESKFPVKVGPDISHNGGADAFVAKINTGGTAFLYSGYIGGSGTDYAFDVAVDAQGSAYVTGWTYSREATFPVRLGPDTSFNGMSDAFVAKVRPSGTGLYYASYIGGSRDEWGSGIAADAVGGAYVTGATESSQTTFPIKTGPDVSQNGGTDAFVAKILHTPGLDANAGPDQLLECASPSGTTVSLDGSGSTDPQGDPLTYSWLGSFGTASGVKPIVNLLLGVQHITLTVKDNHGDSSTDAVDVTIRDTALPRMTLRMTPNVLSPPDHRLVEVTANVGVSDACDANPRVVLVSITSNEADQGMEPGDLPADIQQAVFGQDDRSFLLRAERYSKGAGRIYSVTYEVTDASGKSRRVTGQVKVPVA